jgi:TetR/AcrR family transcriptional regulator
MIDRKDQILEAAKSLFNRLGYNKTSVDDIAQVVGMKKSSLYYYYKNKEELFCCAYISDWSNIMEEFTVIAEKEKTPVDKIMKYISQSLGHYEIVVLQHNIHMRVIIETRNVFMDIFNEINLRSCDFFEMKINEGIKEGIFKKVDANRVAKAILNTKTSTMYDNFMQFINQVPKHENFEKINDEVFFTIELMLEGIKKK